MRLPLSIHWPDTTHRTNRAVPWLVALVFAAIATLTSAFAQDLAPIPALVSRVTDTTGTLGASAKQSLDAKLQAFEQATGGQLAVLVVKTAEPETIDQYGIRVGEAWKIGKKGKDGLLSDMACVPLALQSGSEPNLLTFFVEYTVRSNGPYSYGVRVMPYHPRLSSKVEPGLVFWG